LARLRGGAVAPEIKFCGMTRAEDVAVAAGLGAHYVGVIFAGGPRHQSPDGATRLLGGTVPPPRRVAVVAGQTTGEIADLARTLTLDVVQLHADSDATRVHDVRRAAGTDVWAVLRIEGAELPPSFGELADAADAIVLDARVPGVLGGSGVALPWRDLARALAPVRGDRRIVLAGGLRPENVEEAISAIEPDVVDVSSGVESAPGVKDHEKMRAFRDAVQRAGAGTR
jgi:phosphoribosylanthranilate isomerase